MCSLLPPANEVCEGYVFTGVCLSTPTGHVWFYSGGACVALFGEACVVLFGGMHGFIQGVCMVLFRGCAWFYLGGMHGFIQGVCVVLFRGACVVLFRRVYMVLFGGHAWFYLGGMVLFGGCGFLGGRGHAWFFWGACVVFFSFFGYNEIQSMSGRYTSYWNAFLFIYAFRHIFSLMAILNSSKNFLISSQKAELNALTSR